MTTAHPTITADLSGLRRMCSRAPLYTNGEDCFLVVKLDADDFVSLRYRDGDFVPPSARDKPLYLVLIDEEGVRTWKYDRRTARNMWLYKDFGHLADDLLHELTPDWQNKYSKIHISFFSDPF